MSHAYAYVYDAADNVVTKYHPWHDDFADGTVANDGFTVASGTWNVVNSAAQNNSSTSGDVIIAQDANYASTLGPVAKRFTGYLYDVKGNIYQTPFRAYSPTTARWLQPDPLGMISGPKCTRM